MQIVIDIPDGYVGVIASNQRMEGCAMDKLIRQAIIDGTVLPKGHGDLIDRNTVQMSAEKFHSLGDLHTAQWVVNNTPVVIPADKGE